VVSATALFVNLAHLLEKSIISLRRLWEKVHGPRCEVMLLPYVDAGLVSDGSGSRAAVTQPNPPGLMFVVDATSLRLWPPCSRNPHPFSAGIDGSRAFEVPVG